jgi:hypothetical protein
MRIRRYLLAELLFLALCLVGAVVLARVSLRWLGDRHTPKSIPEVVSVHHPVKVTEGPPILPVPVPEIFEEPTGNFLGMSDDLLVERLRTQPVVKVQRNKGGSSLSFRMDLADGSRAAFKPAQTNLQTIPRKEVAAYRLSRLLGLDAVPPAVPRMFSREELFSHLHPVPVPLWSRIQNETIFNPAGKTAGVMMYWIPVLKDPGLDTPEGIMRTTAWLTQGQTIPPSFQSLAAQLSDLVLFDFLISNPDRYSGGNLLTNADGSRLLFMDNTMSFFIEPEGSEKTRQVLHRTQRFSARLYTALDRISETSLHRIFSRVEEGTFEILTPAEIRAVVARRDYVRTYVSSLFAVHGQAKVLCFP